MLQSLATQYLLTQERQHLARVEAQALKTQVVKDTVNRWQRQSPYVSHGPHWILAKPPCHNEAQKAEEASNGKTAWWGPKRGKKWSPNSCEQKVDIIPIISFLEYKWSTKLKVETLKQILI